METTSAECLVQLSETHPKFTCQLSWWVIALTVQVFRVAWFAEARFHFTDWSVIKYSLSPFDPPDCFFLSCQLLYNIMRHNHFRGEVQMFCRPWHSETMTLLTNILYMLHFCVLDRKVKAHSPSYWQGHDGPVQVFSQALRVIISQSSEWKQMESRQYSI